MKDLELKTTPKNLRLPTIFGALALSVIGIGCSSSQAERDPKADTPQKMEQVVALADSAGARGASAESESESKSKSKVNEKADKKKMDIDYEAEVRNENNHIVMLSTNYGDLVLELYHDLAPNHADSFYARVEDGFYDGLIFHRIMKGFMIQGGDPTGTGMGDRNKPGYTLDAEFSKVKHKRGILSMARVGRGPADDPKGYNTASCQFFVCHADAANLDGQYTVFGNLLAGYETLDKIANVATGANNRPVEEVKILKTSIIK